MVTVNYSFSIINMYVRFILFLGGRGGGGKIFPPVLSCDDSCERRGQYPHSSQQALPGGVPVQGSQNEGPTQWVVG